jgi:hypothetical protein
MMPVAPSEPKVACTSVLYMLSINSSWHSLCLSREIVVLFFFLHWQIRERFLKNEGHHLASEAYQ